jgi:hypothetical protein
MTSAKHPKSKRRSLNRIERKRSDHKSLVFPQMKGRIVDKIEFYTTADFHGLIIDFQDKTSLSLTIEPGFLLCSKLLDRSTGTERVRKRWRGVRSVTDKDRVIGRSGHRVI